MKVTAISVHLRLVLNPDRPLTLSVYMHALGRIWITAYGGLLEAGPLRDGEHT
jgi:NADPH-dependent curcumin reductase CurA